MREKTEGFPWQLLAETESQDETFNGLMKRMVEQMTGVYIDGDVNEIRWLLEDESFPDEAMAIMHGLCNNTWREKSRRGVACRDNLSDTLVEIALFWCGVAAARGFLAGMKHGDRIVDLCDLLEGVDLGESDDLG